MANDFITHQSCAPQAIADPFHKGRLLPKRFGMVKALWQDLICTDNFRVAKWDWGGLTYMLYRSTREMDASVIGVVGNDGLSLSHYSYLKGEVGTGEYYANILSNLPYARKDGALGVMVVKSRFPL